MAGAGLSAAERPLGRGRDSAGDARTRTRRRPFGGLPTRTVPPCRSATWRTIDRPRPEPGMRAGLGGAVEPVEHVRQVGLGDAVPLVGDQQRARRRAGP